MMRCVTDSERLLSPDGFYYWDVAAQQWVPVESPDAEEAWDAPSAAVSVPDESPATPMIANTSAEAAVSDWETVSVFSASIKAKLAEKYRTKVIEPALRPGERMLFATKCSQFKPLTTFLAVTNQRLLTGDGMKVATDIGFDESLNVTTDGKERVEAQGGKDRRLVFKAVPSQDHATLLSAVTWAREHYDPAARQQAEAEHAAVHGPPPGTTGGNARPAEVSWPDTKVVGGRLSKKASLAIGRQCHGDEPWMILVSGGSAGLLAAFADRLVIIKTGFMTSAMAGSFGGERSAIFYFSDVTGLEYNSGMMSGVLEVLTASYNGTANRDYWRGSTKSRNADSNDPWTLSNTLPLMKTEYNAALPQIGELRKRIAAAKNPTVNVTMPETVVPAAAAASLSDELRNLGELHAQGILSAEEFAAAKARLLGG